MMMKKIISCVLLMMMLMCVTNVSAQWSVTPEAGMNVTKYKNSPATIGFKAGAAVKLYFWFGIVFTSIRPVLRTTWSRDSFIRRSRRQSNG